jgi:hypothetical protein
MSSFEILISLTPPRANTPCLASSRNATQRRSFGFPSRRPVAHRGAPHRTAAQRSANSTQRMRAPEPILEKPMLSKREFTLEMCRVLKQQHPDTKSIGIAPQGQPELRTLNTAVVEQWLDDELDLVWHGITIK